MKYYKVDHFRNAAGTLDIYFNYYTTKSGYLKFCIEIYAAQTWNENGFTTRIARYTTDENALLKYMYMHPDFYLVEVINND
jgi:hypothetical protein